MSVDKLVEYLVVDATAFILNARLQDIGRQIITCSSVVDEIKNKRQLRRLVVLPYDLIVKDVDPENIKIIREFAKKTGDYPSLSTTDIKIMALTYQLHKEHVGTDGLRVEPVMQKPEITTQNKVSDTNPDVTGFFIPGKESMPSKEVAKEDSSTSEDSEDDEQGWITPSNVDIAKRQVNSQLLEEKHVVVACMTTDFAMQNVLKQMNLNVTSLDGRLIKHLRTYILRCYACFKTTSIMTKRFCPNCGNDTLKKVAVSLGEDSKLVIHINPKRPLTGRGKKYSLPTIRGGKHPNNPILVEDQPMPDNKPTRLARMKNNPLDDDYIAGYSPFVMRDLNSKSAQLGIRPGQQFKYWMKKNPNEATRRRKK
nr:unnamed protein product [Callosobruchus analis]